MQVYYITDNTIMNQNKNVTSAHQLACSFVVWTRAENFNSQNSACPVQNENLTSQKFNPWKFVTTKFPRIRHMHKINCMYVHCTYVCICTISPHSQQYVCTVCIQTLYCMSRAHIIQYVLCAAYSILYLKNLTLINWAFSGMTEWMVWYVDART